MLPDYSKNCRAFGAAVGLLLLGPCLVFCGEDARHPITFDDLIGFARVADPQISPDGRWVAYSVTRYSKERNAGNSDIWIVPLAGGIRDN